MIQNIRDFQVTSSVKIRSSSRTFKSLPDAALVINYSLKQALLPIVDLLLNEFQIFGKFFGEHRSMFRKYRNCISV